LDEVLGLGGVFNTIDELKARLVASHSERSRRIETGEQIVVGVNRFTEAAPSPLGGDESIMRVDPAVEAEMVADVTSWRSRRDDGAVRRALDELRRTAEGEDNIMEATIALARAGGTTGEWAGTLREVFGEYRAPTGVAGAVGHRGELMATVAARVKQFVGGPPRLLVAKPGLDGHSNGAEQIAVAARDAGMEVIYQGIRLSPAQIAAAARDEDVDAIGISILSGSHLELVPEVLDALRQAGVNAPVVVGGIIPEEDRPKLVELGVAAVYTPKDFEFAKIMDDLATLVERHRADVAAE
jgi:(2R)-ethylmalonyl-CoA mutase